MGIGSWKMMQLESRRYCIVRNTSYASILVLNAAVTAPVSFLPDLYNRSLRDHIPGPLNTILRMALHTAIGDSKEATGQ